MEILNGLRDTVRENGAHTLPGCSIKFDSFLPVLQRAQSRGYVKDHEAEYAIEGLINGFTLGLDVGAMKRLGKRAFRNYPTAYGAHSSVTAAVLKRLQKNKSVRLGPAVEALKELMDYEEALAVFPMGAVLKPNQSDELPPEQLEWRPTDDHTKTGFNAHTILGILGHSLNTYKEVEWFLKKDLFMTVGDVEDGFLLLPLHPDIWLFMLFRWSCSGPEAPEDLLMHLFADFGARGTPGTFQLFIVRIVVQMARSEMVITLPLVVYVDDAGIIGGTKEECDREMLGFQGWSREVCGVPWKIVKNRPGAIPQYYIGFWWHSHQLTRSLDSQKLTKYLAELAVAFGSPVLTLRDRQSLAGKVQRAIMTMPPGAACLLVNCYNMMSRLTLPWHSRRTSKAERDDYRFTHALLQYNVGKGYYAYDTFAEGPTVLSDASKSKRYTGGGYIESYEQAPEPSAFYDFWKYGTSAARKPIDYLEGDTVLQWCRDRGAKWRGHMVHFGIDNQAFQRSAKKGRSVAPRLNTLLKELFVLQVQHGFVLNTFWISTDDNFLSDHLSRDREDMFLMVLPDSKFVVVPMSELRRAEDAGRVKCLPDNEDPGMDALRQLLAGCSSNNLRDGPSRGPGVGGDAQILSVSYDFTTIYEGLPPDVVEELDRVMDNRLAVSSRSKMMSGFNRWSSFCEDAGWSPFLRTGDKRRGGRLVAWVMQMMRDTELVFASISTYTWGVRTWHVLQHQADPCFGVMHWREFMAGIAVLTAVPGEPRAMFPLEDFKAIMGLLVPEDFEDAQFGLLMLVLLFTFSRTECPCPKSWTGPNTFDPSAHWQVRDFRLVRMGEAWVLWVRFKGIKQDPRMERDSVRGAPDLPFEDEDVGVGHDWVPIGDVPDDEVFSVAFWYMACVRALARKRDREAPMFLSKDRKRAYTYTCLRADLRRRQLRLDLPTKPTPHGIRVLGYNMSKATNGEDLTVAHGGWLSSAHDRYERFSQARQFSIPANMVGARSVFGAAGASRDVMVHRTTRNAFAVPVPESEDDGPDPEGGAADDPDVSSGELLPPGYVATSHCTPAGRTYCTYASEGGPTLRSRVDAWRVYTAQCEQRNEEGYAPFVPDVSTPVVLGSANGHRRGTRSEERLSSIARRVAGSLPRGGSYEFQDVYEGQCGNPDCVVPSRNGKHPGDCRFREPAPRR